MAGLHVPLSTLRHHPRGSPTHDLGPPWIATPSISGVLIPFPIPVYPGAFPDVPSPAGGVLLPARRAHDHRDAARGGAGRPPPPRPGLPVLRDRALVGGRGRAGRGRADRGPAAAGGRAAAGRGGRHSAAPLGPSAARGRVASRRRRPRAARGHRGVVLGIVVRVPFMAHRPLCLPVLARLWQPGNPERTPAVLAREL